MSRRHKQLDYTRKESIKLLNSIVWSDKITRDTKKTIYNTILESISTHCSEVWNLTERNKSRMKAMETDFGRRSCSLKAKKITNVEIRERMQVDGTIIDTIGTKRLICYGHLNIMNKGRWPKKVYNWIPAERKNVEDPDDYGKTTSRRQ